VIRGDLSHGATEKLQGVGDLVAIQKMLHLRQIFLYLGGLLSARVAEQLVHADTEVIGNGGERVHIGIANAGFPTGYGLGSHAEIVGQLILGHVVFFAEQTNFFADLDLCFHVCNSFQR